jgi:Tfp pilus assembly protein PilN
MIEINLARQLQGSVDIRKSSWLAWWLIGGLLFVGIGTATWWWTQFLQEQRDALLYERMLKTQSLVHMQERLKTMERVGEQKKLLMSWVEQINDQEKEKARPVALLDGINQSVDRLNIWLERVQLEAQVVELHGQSLDLEDIGKFIESLENDQVIRSLPVVEIQDRPEGDSATYSFMIRFIFDQKVMT